MPHYTQYNSAGFIADTPQQKTVPNSTTTYHSIRLSYNEGKGPIDFEMEGPELTSIGGIIESEQKNGDKVKKEYQLRTSLNQNVEALKNFSAVINNIYMQSVAAIDKYKGVCGMGDFDPTRPAAGKCFTSPIFQPRDKATSQLLDVPPLFFIKLLNRIVGGFAVRSLFTLADGTTLDWNVLRSVEMKFIPKLHFESLYIGGGKVRLQIKLKSAVVTDLKGLNTENTQIETMKTLAADKDAMSRITDQLNKITLARKDAPKMETTKPPEPKADAKSGAQTMPLKPSTSQTVQFSGQFPPGYQPTAGHPASGGYPSGMTAPGMVMGFPQQGMMNPSAMQPGQSMMGMVPNGAISSFMANMPANRNT